MSLLMVEEEGQNKSTMEIQVQEGVAATTISVAAVEAQTGAAPTTDSVAVTETVSAAVTKTVSAMPSNYVSNSINILKGKRTKRQRPQSPLSFTLAPTNSSSNIRGCDGVNSTTASDQDCGSPTTTEEEEIAKCLLLLSQGGPKNYNNFGTVPFKFCSKRYVETSTTTNGKCGIYVYQCKTCNRTFPSFQALGGHRASHRKPKNIVATTADDKSYKPMILSDEDEDHNNQQQQSFKRSFSASSLSLQLSTRVISSNTINNIDYNKSSPKFHECAICGTEFTSGQALGGHMRRHRGATLNKTTATANTKTLSFIPFCPSPISAIDPIDYQHEPKKLKSESVNLSLDLNLPATVVENNNITNLEPSTYSLASQQQPKQQQHQQQKQSPLVLSTAPTLVDCQY